MAVRNAASVLPEPGRRGDERVAAGGDRLPAAQLRGGRLADFGREPLTNDRMKTSEGHGSWGATVPENPYFTADRPLVGPLALCYGFDVRRFTSS